MKNPTAFIDVDGVLFRHKEKGASLQWTGDHDPIPGSIDLLDEMERRGWHVVLTTARPESNRPVLERELREAGLIYHQLVMGVTSGVRVIVNDAKPGGAQSAVAVTTERNALPDAKEFCDAVEAGSSSGRWEIGALAGKADAPHPGR
jgi:ribonucleotide monophosphatase NagD (HAD superfamily)